MSSLSTLRKISITQHYTAPKNMRQEGSFRHGTTWEAQQRNKLPAKLCSSCSSLLPARLWKYVPLERKQCRNSYQPASPEFPFVHGQPHSSWKHSSSHFRFNLGSVTYAHLCLHLLLNDTQARRSMREKDGIWYIARSLFETDLVLWLLKLWQNF